MVSSLLQRPVFPFSFAGDLQNLVYRVYSFIVPARAAKRTEIDPHWPDDLINQTRENILGSVADSHKVFV